MGRLPDNILLLYNASCFPYFEFTVHLCNVLNWGSMPIFMSEKKGGQRSKGLLEILVCRKPSDKCLTDLFCCNQVRETDEVFDF